MTFPAEAVPDDAIFAPHHYLYPLYFVLLASLVVWDDYKHKEPVLVVVGVLIGLIGWFHFWPFYPVVGATLVLLSCPIIIVGAFHRDVYPLWYRSTVVILALVALDDAISHAFGVWTPLDWLWKAYIFQYMA